MDWAGTIQNIDQNISISGNYNDIGGALASEGNTITAYYSIGIFNNNLTISNGVGNRIRGNYINKVKIIISGSAGSCMIGGNRLAGEGNVMSGYITIDGIGGNTVCGNTIGLNQSQTASISIEGPGVEINSDSNFIGLSQDGYGNIISGNTSYGIRLNSDNSHVNNNLIGISSDNSSFSNGTGIDISGNNNIVGGRHDDLYFEKNIISGNGSGIQITGQANTVSGNYIGTNISGNSAISNVTGIVLLGSNNIIGGANTSENSRGNVVSGNSERGIMCMSGGFNVIIGNYIGIDATGTATIPNIIHGIYLSASNNIIGGDSEYEKNIICCGDVGIYILGGATTSNTIYNNWFGVYTNLALAAQSFITASIYLEASTNHNNIGIKNTWNSGNLITNAPIGIGLLGATTDNNGLFANTICAFSGSGISLAGDGANNNKAAPVILISPAPDVSLISGTTSGSDDYIELFVSDRGAGVYGGSLRLVGSTTAVSGNWSIVPTGLAGGEYVSAIATDSSNNSSGFSLNALVQVPTPTSTPTTTATPTPTPVGQVQVHSISPEYKRAATQQKVIIRGSGYQVPMTVKLARSGADIATASNVTVLDYNTLQCTFDLSNIASGPGNVVVTSAGVKGTLTNGLKVLGTIPSPIHWDITDMGQAGAPAVSDDTCGVWVADGDNDGSQEVFSAGLLQNILKYDLDNTWSIAPLPSGSIGEYYTAVLTADMDNDGENEVYGATLDHHVYAFSGTNFSTKTDVAGDLGYEIIDLAWGDGNNDHAPKLYAAGGDNNEGYVYQFSYSSGWSNTVIASTSEKIYSIAVADGNNDDINEIYAACADNKVYQYIYNGTAWAQSIVHTGGSSARVVTVGDGNNDGENEVYTANSDDHIYQAKWSTGFFWSPLTITARDALGLVVTDADNNGTTELYSAGSDRTVYQYQFTGSTWTETPLLEVPDDVYALAAGDGDNDYLLELYALAGNHHVYEINAAYAVPTATPTRTPVLGFEGQIISKDHIYAAPNPVRGHHANIVIYTQQPAEVSAKLFTTSNQEVLSFRRHYSIGKHTERINISNLANGVYLLLVRAKANGKEERVIKKIAIVK
ncbi:T9SS type A sorting domain-containing protein [bacterium]|nr:T9SS type A sorting domain-containing protein [bacterium]